MTGNLGRAAAAGAHQAKVFSRVPAVAEVPAVRAVVPLEVVLAAEVALLAVVVVKAVACRAHWAVARPAAGELLAAVLLVAAAVLEEPLAVRLVAAAGR